LHNESQVKKIQDATKEGKFSETLVKYFIRLGEKIPATDATRSLSASVSNVKTS